MFDACDLVARHATPLHQKMPRIAGKLGQLFEFQLCLNSDSAAKTNNIASSSMKMSAALHSEVGQI
jgi:uncharacterized protein YceH (UPF0502 family)